jgi:flagellar motor switch protein FliM
VPGADAEQATAALVADEPAGEAEIRVRAVDFSQPSKFTSELRRRLATLAETWSGGLGQDLAEQLKAEVSFAVAEVEQRTWAAATAALPADSLAVAVELGERRLLLSLELPLVLQALECLLGGSAAQAPSARALSELDVSLATSFLDAMLPALADAWGALEGVEPRRGEIDLEGDAGVQVAPGEPTLAISLRSEIDGALAGAALLVPWPAVATLAAGPTDAPAVRTNEQEARKLERRLACAKVLLRAEVGACQMPVERMLDIVPGAVLELAERAEQGVCLYAEDILLARGRPGRSGARRALKLQVADELPARAQTYAKLGRAELERARAWAASPPPADSERPALLASILVRVWAELGRAHTSLAAALELAPGAVVELEQDAEEPVELFANGLCFARGALLVTGEGAWAVQVQELL